MVAKRLERSAAEVFLEQAIREGRATKHELSLSAVTVDTRFQSRVETDPAHVQHLASLMDTDTLRPIVVFRDGDTYLLADGFHRHAAHRKQGRPSIWAYVMDGCERDVILYSASANLENSKPVSREDRRKAAKMILACPETRNMNLAELSRRCGINRSSAHKYRNEYFKEMGWDLPDDVDVMVGGHLTTRSRSTVRIREPRYFLASGGRNGRIPSAYFCYRSTRVYLGKDSPETKAKFESMKKAALQEEDLRRSADPISLRTNDTVRQWIIRRGVSIRATGDGLQVVNGLVGDGWVSVVMPKGDATSLFSAWGRVRCLGRTIPGMRMIVIYQEEGIDALGRQRIDLATADGVEFMTPEQLVSEFGPKTDAGNGAGNTIDTPPSEAR